MFPMSHGCTRNFFCQLKIVKHYDELRCEIGTNNPLERTMREIRRRTKVIGELPDSCAGQNQPTHCILYSSNHKGVGCIPNNENISQ